MTVLEKLQNFYDSFKGEKGSIGKTFYDRDIYYFKIVKTESPILLFQYGIHAREYITTYLSTLQISDFMERGKRGTVYFIPALNVDGIEIALSSNPLYKANGRGVDLNVNFDARWGKGKTNSFIKGIPDYVGEKPFSEPETQALRGFTYLIKPNLTVSYHSKGEEIYYKFHQSKENLRRDFELAKVISNLTSYQIKDTPNSAGGYKDWCIDKLNIPAFTIEVGKDSLSHPIGEEHALEIFDKNKDVVIALTEKL